MIELLDRVPSLLASGLAVFGLVLALLWKGDDLISKQGQETLKKAVAGALDAGPASVSADVRMFVERFLPPAPHTVIYMRNVALLSLAALVAVAAVYFSRVGGFWDQFNVGRATALNFGSQLFVDGFLKVFLVNYIGLLPHRYYVARLSEARLLTCTGLLVLDVALRLLIFLVVSAIIYVCFARWFGSFGGDAMAALRSLPETYTYAARFANLTGVYLYAVAFSSLPLFFAVFLRLMVAHPKLFRVVRTLLFWMPLADKPVRLAAIFVAILLGAFGLTTSAILTPIAHAGG